MSSFEEMMADYIKLISIQISGDENERIKQEIITLLTHDGAAYLNAIKICESPIEKLLLLRLIQYIDHYQIQYGALGFDFHLQAQTEVSASKHKYRTDFMLTCFYRQENKTVKIAIECDGHDFHEKTKEQAKRDKSRDRNLNKENIQVVRFTGSEIWASPSDCAKEVFKILETLIGLQEIVSKYYDL